MGNKRGRDIWKHDTGKMRKKDKRSAFQVEQPKTSAPDRALVTLQCELCELGVCLQANISSAAEVEGRQAFCIGQCEYVRLSVCLCEYWWHRQKFGECFVWFDRPCLAGVVLHQCNVVRFSVNLVHLEENGVLVRVVLHHVVVHLYCDAAQRKQVFYSLWNTITH